MILKRDGGEAFFSVASWKPGFGIRTAAVARQQAWVGGPLLPPFKNIGLLIKTH